jgi:hypothetical protein
MFLDNDDRTYTPLNLNPPKSITDNLDQVMRCAADRTTAVQDNTQIINNKAKYYVDTN